MKKELSRRTQNSLNLISDETNETVSKGGDLVAIMTRHIRIRPHNEFVILFADSLFQCMHEFKLTATETKVILRYIHYAQFGNLLSLDPNAIIQDCGINRQQLSRARRKLVECGILLEVGKSLFLNPQIITKGELYKYVTDYQELTEMGAKVLKEKLGQEAKYSPCAWG